MKVNHLRFMVLLLIVLCFYLVVFRTRTVTYQGENANWHVRVQAKLTGLNGTHTIRIKYKGKKSIRVGEYHIKPFFEGEQEPELINGEIVYQCTDDCGYYSKNETLIFFIAWVEGANQIEKINLIDMSKKE